MPRSLDLAPLHALRDHKHRLLAVFPHPDDESYGCAGALKRAAADPDVATVLLCMTDGEGSSQFDDENLDRETIALRRTVRMERVAELTRVDVLLMPGLPDGGLGRIPLSDLLEPIRDVITVLDPTVVIGHDIRGVNGHPDHIAAHWALRMALEGRPTTRFAQVCYSPEVAASAQPRLLFPTPLDRIDCRLALEQVEIEVKEQCLRIHDAHISLVDETETGRVLRPPVECFEFWGESHQPPLDDLFAGLPEAD
ncbi:MAG: PIG-L family deacetylase [Planctomycetota bacterium]|nr:PIG-L family deacetylase [Planctomycetota bacterium]